MSINNHKKIKLTVCHMIFILIMVSGSAAFAARGSLSLVSMGTGDPDNMTIRAKKTIDAADLFFVMGGKNRYPELINDKPVYNAEHGLFGKGGARPRRSPEEAEKLRIENRKIIRDAVTAGKNVVILDNGDPCIFGPHIGYMEEFSDLKPVLVPGISSFNAANAVLKTSVVKGDARAVMLTIGSVENGRDEFLARQISDGITLVFFMVRDMDKFISAMGAKLPGDTPAAVISNAGSSEKEKLITAKLSTLKASINGVDLGPFLLYIGESVKQ